MNQHKILLLEDNVNDAHLTQRTLMDSGVDAEFRTAATPEDFFAALSNEHFGLVISDSCVGDLSALQALHATTRQQPHSSFIIVSGGFDERQAALARQAGAVEWVPKDQLHRLPSIAKLALERAALRDQDLTLSRSNEHLNIEARTTRRLIQAVRDLSMARDVGSIQEIVRHAARELTGADGASFVLRDADMCHYVDEDAVSPLWKGQRFPMSACISGWAMLNRQSAIVPDIECDPRIPLQAYRSTFVKSLVMVPIRPEAPIGAIGNYWAQPHTATPQEVERLQALADSTSIAFENVKLYHELEERVRARTAALRDANQSLEEFSYFASHDLRAPVRHVRAFADILEQSTGESLAGDARHALNRIKNSSKTMSELLDGFLALAKLGRHALQPRALDMTSLAASSAATIKEQNAAAVEIRIASMPETRGDEALIRQVWTNLIGNAVKFSSTRPSPIVEVGALEKEGVPCYFVRDNGVGFDSAHASQLFAAFRRLHSGEFSGNGIGLSIVERIVNRHGGRIWAESKPNAGATFYFTLSH